MGELFETKASPALPAISSNRIGPATGMSLNYGGKTELVQGELVSGNYFPVLGVGAAIGRVFTAQDDLVQGGHPVAVLGYAYWQSRFAGDPGIIGKNVTENGYPLTIVGVSAKGFAGVEPDFALVKFKKLAGGGYFKIANQSLEPALRNLRYSNSEIHDILRYVLGTLSLEESPNINRATLKRAGFTEDELHKIEESLPAMFELSFAFSPWTISASASVDST